MGFTLSTRVTRVGEGLGNDDNITHWRVCPRAINPCLYLWFLWFSYSSAFSRMNAKTPDSATAVPIF